MKPGENFNHPPKGSRISVDPITNLEDIRAMMKLTKSNPRNFLILVLGINSGLRASDLLKLKISDMNGLKVKIGDTIKVTETKTGAKNFFVINKPIFKGIKLYKETYDYDEDSYLFQSRKKKDGSKKRPLSVPSLNRLVKDWSKAINLKGNFGCHSLRKSWGYHMRKQYGVSFEVIQKRFAHSSPAVTVRYLGVQNVEVKEALMHEIC